MDRKKLLIREEPRPLSHSPDAELEWLVQSLGFDDEGSSDKTAFKIFKRIVTSPKKDGVTSMEITQYMKLSRVGTLYHLNKFMSAGLVVRDGRKYRMRAENLERTLEEVEEDFLRMFRKMAQIAESIDKKALARKK